MSNKIAYCKKCNKQSTFREVGTCTFTTDLIVSLITLFKVRHVAPYHECDNCGTVRKDL